MSKIRNCSALLFLIVCFISCAHTNNNLSNKLKDHPVALKSGLKESPHALVTLRYPVGFDPVAERQANACWSAMSTNLFNKHTSTGDPEGEKTTEQSSSESDPDSSTANQSPAQLTAIKSHYWALELYSSLIRYIPACKVILQPETVVLDKSGNFSYKNHNIIHPTVMLVDYFAYVGKDLMAPFTSQGEYITPMISVRTSVNGNPKLHGALMESTELKMPFRPAETKDSGDRLNAGSGKEITLLLNSRGSISEGLNIPYDDSWPPTMQGIYPVSVGHFEMNTEAITRQAEQKSGNVQSSPCATLNENLAKLIVEILNHLNVDDAIKGEKTAYIALFDGPLSSRYSSNTLMDDDPQKLALIQKFASKEQDFLGEQASQVFNKLYKGQFGEEVRQVNRSEMETRSQIKEQRINTFISILGALAVGVSGAVASARYNSPEVMNVAVASSMPLITSAAHAANAAEAAKDDFYSAYDKIWDSSYEISVSSGKSDEIIRAERLPELREKMRIFYEQKFSKQNDTEQKKGKKIKSKRNKS